jgi:WD40 repeat protein
MTSVGHSTGRPWVLLVKEAVADCQGAVHSAVQECEQSLNATQRQIEHPLRLGPILQNSSDYFYGITFSPDSKTIAATSSDSKTLLWDVQSGTIMPKTFDAQAPDHLYVFEGSMSAFSPDGRRFASVAGTGSTINVWDIFTMQTAHLQLERPNSIAFSPDGKLFAAGSDYGVVRLWDVATWKNLSDWQHLDTVMEVTFSNDSKQLASASLDNTVRLWDVIKYEPGHVLKGNDGKCRFYSVAFSPDGKLLASGTEGTVKLWNVDTGKPAGGLPHSSIVKSVAFSPDGNQLASAPSDSTVRLWDVATWTQIGSLGHASNVGRVVFSPDGKILASAGQSIRLGKQWAYHGEGIVPQGEGVFLRLY